MDEGTLGAALEHEHREIDEGIAAFSSGQREGNGRIEPLTRAIAGLRRHIYLEEEFLFPPMRPEFAMPIIVMLREHGELWRTLDTLEAKLGESGADASVLEVCGELVARLDSHNSKEEPIFYTQADRALTASANAELKAFLDSGQMPAGWVCQGARS
jgi:regulator of cell morphogenesis and NO signaling